ncbi:hypothetical protein FRC17_001592 [Serendipita sp. 399]|nr:hypothetical protein FRC17_001592 [Serendipita sp. 399]
MIRVITVLLLSTSLQVVHPCFAKTAVRKVEVDVHGRDVTPNIPSKRIRVRPGKAKSSFFKNGSNPPRDPEVITFAPLQQHDPPHDPEITTYSISGDAQNTAMARALGQPVEVATPVTNHSPSTTTSADVTPATSTILSLVCAAAARRSHIALPVMVAHPGASTSVMILKIAENVDALASLNHLSIVPAENVSAMIPSMFTLHLLPVIFVAFENR